MNIRAKFTQYELQPLFKKDNLIRNIYIGKRKFPDTKLLNYMVSQYNANLFYIDKTLKDLFNYVISNKDKITLLISSDHGEGLGNHIINNRLWFGHHKDLYREAIWIPLIIFPAKDKHKKLRSNIVENIDFMPTILEL